MEREKTEEIKSSNPINQDEIQLYLKDIRKLKVMTPEREKILSKMITDENCTEREKEFLMGLFK
jgi:ribosomal protein S18